MDAVCSPEHAYYHICAVSYMLCPCREQAWSGLWAPWTILNVSKANNMTENIILDNFKPFSSGYRSKKYFLFGKKNVREEATD